MRRYVSRKDLVSVLNDLLEKKDPYIREVYREVMLYRFSKNPKNPEKVEKMLSRPAVLFLSCVDLLILCTGFLFVRAAAQAGPFSEPLVLLFLSLCVCAELLRLQHLVRSARQFLPYVFIDELIARKILVVSTKPAESSAHGKPHTAK